MVDGFPQIGKMLVVFGLVFIVIGILLTSLGKVPGVGKLPGDIYIKKENFSFFFPITSCIVISVILSILFWVFNKK